MSDYVFTSDFWSWWVILLTVANILGCWWLIIWASKKAPGEATTGDVTGHTWDDTLQEYNNPLPRWWLWMFHLTLIFGLGYLVYYPGLGKFEGSAKWSQESQYEAEMAEAAANYGPIFAKYAGTELTALAANTEATKVGHRLFLNYCATCHASDAGGAPGFPSLTDNDWLYGGDANLIKTSILDGRSGVMPGWQAALGDDGVKNVTAYVMKLSGRPADEGAASAGKTQFDMMCVACHLPDGTGNQALGAPNLTDKIWLYGGSAGAIAQTIANGRNGIMPPHRDFLGEDKVHVLAAYVYSLSK